MEPMRGFNISVFMYVIHASHHIAALLKSINNRLITFLLVLQYGADAWVHHMGIDGYNPRIGPYCGTNKINIQSINNLFISIIIWSRCAHSLYQYSYMYIINNNLNFIMQYMINCTS